jgi:hypothetical protein
LALGPRRPLSRQTAWGCFTTNLAMPGAGSLVAGRVSGYLQLALAIGGMALTILFGIRFGYWYVANWTRFHGPEIDPMNALGEMWLVLRWAVLGIGVFAVGWLWALASSSQIVLSARKAELATAPPRLRPEQLRNSTPTTTGNPTADRGVDTSQGP